MFTPVSRHKLWLRRTARFFEVPQGRIVKGSYKDIPTCKARQTFYWLCFRDRIDLYQLSKALGKDRTSIICSLKRSQNRDKWSEEEILKIN